MKTLDSNSLVDLIERCATYPMYQAIIVLANQQRLREFICSARKCINEPDFDGIKCVTRAGIIKFQNGSYIRPIPYDTKAKGLQANEVVVDDEIDNPQSIKDKIKELFYHCSEEDTSEELVSLDDFLNDFKIVE